MKQDLKQFTVAITLTAILGLSARAQLFTPGRVAVLRIGNGVPNNAGNPISDWNNKQNPIFIDEFDPNVTNATTPTVTVAIPTNGQDSLFLNGNAGSEGEGCTLSADRSALTATGYHGDILSQPGTPSNLPYLRGITVIDAFGTNHLALARNDWYGFATGKTNPRGVVSDDGTNNFWGSGNVVGTLYFNPEVNDGAPQFLQNLSDTRSVKIINNTLYTTIIGKDSKSPSYPAGIYTFVDFNGNPDPLPTGFAGFHLVVPAFDKYTNVCGFYINPQGTIAYTADLAWGVQKYIKSGGQWQFACNYSVKGYEQTASGTVITNDVKNGFGGCWDVVVDFSGTNPVLYATTEDFSFYNGNANSNRIVRIVDTNSDITGLTITNFTVVAQATGTNVGFRAIDFTPDLRPLITSVPADQSVVTNISATFSITATASATALSAGPITYQWIENGTNLVGQTAATLTFAALLSDDGTTYQCIASDHYGSVTSTPPGHLTVTTTPVAPLNAGSFQNLTNAAGDNVFITVDVGGTTPLSYQWYAGTVQLSDTNEFSGTTNGTLLISGAQFGVDDTNYSCVVTNSVGSTNILAAKLTLVVPKPAFSSQPASTTVLSNSPAQFSVTGFGSSLSYQWYTNGVAVSGATANTLAINPAVKSIASITVVVTNLGGAITSAPVTLTVVAPPPHSFVNYTNGGQVYVQSFDSLPVVTNVTANADNPVLVYQFGSVNPVTYSLDNPFDFTYPILTSGGVGGLGLSNTMQGWYGWGSVASHFGGHQGDQSKGGIIDFGTLSATNANLGGTNRALGLLSTSTSGSSAFGVKFINNSTNSLSYITLNYIGEIWRNQPVSNSLVFSFYIDTAGTNAFSPTNGSATFVSSMDVNFNTNAAGLLILDGTQSSNQISLAVTNLAVGDWPTNAALWLVWQQMNGAGGAQGIAIDKLNFFATTAPVAAPAAVTQPASGITAGSAMLNATINPNGTATTYWFQYGTNTSYGSVTPTNALSSGTSVVPVTNPVGGLLQGTVYHYQLAANNSLGTSVGGDASFATLAVTPSQLGGVAFGGGGLHFTFTNATGASFTVLATTNLALPLTNWTVLVGHPIEGPAGQYQFVDPQATNNAQRFYILRQP